MFYANENEPFACDWLAKLFPEMTIDQRSIRDVQPADLAGFQRCHFFAGIGGWELALQLAGWPDEREVWTGSAPCQPFSSAGKRKGNADERHLWPDWFRLIRERRPAVIFGEQVASADVVGRANRKKSASDDKPCWLDGVFSDLEAEGYACGAAVLGAHSVGSPHIRQRLYWVAHACGPRLAGRPLESARKERTTAERSSRAILCRDGKYRRISTEPGDEPLAHGIPRDVGRRIPALRGVAASARRNRVGRLRGYGNAIVPQVAAMFIMAATIQTRSES